MLTGGKDSKVRLWITAELLANSSQHYHELGEATSEITAVRIAAMGSHGFTASLDKTCRIYDLAAKTQIR